MTISQHKACEGCGDGHVPVVLSIHFKHWLCNPCLQRAHDVKDVLIGKQKRLHGETYTFEDVTNGNDSSR